MTDQRQPNMTLQQLKDQHKLTLEKLAEAVNDAAYELTGKRGKCTARTALRWLSGEVTWPQPRTLQALEHVFGRPVGELGFRPPASRAVGLTVGTTPSPSNENMPMPRRRTFILGLTGSLVTLPTLPEAGRLGIADVDRIQSAAADLHKIDDRHGGAQLADIAGRCMEYVEYSARRCTYGDSVRLRLYKALGEIATSAGWFAFDSSQQDAARRWWDTGLRYALLAQDRLLQARIWSSMSHQASKMGHGSEAVAIARAALDQTRGRRDGQLSALLHLRVAHGYAVGAEKGWCGRSLHQAEKEFDWEPSEPQRWLRFFNSGELSSTAALCFLDLRQPTEAVDAARESLKVVQSTPLRRNLFAAHVRLGIALAAAGELEAAAAAGEHAFPLMPEVHSPRINARMTTLRDELVNRGAPGAADFSERYEAVAPCP